MTQNEIVSPDNLTPRELEMIELYLKGFTQRQIGEKVGVSQKTVSRFLSGSKALGYMNKLTAQKVTKLAENVTDYTLEAMRYLYAWGTTEELPMDIRMTAFKIILNSQKDFIKQTNEAELLAMLREQTKGTHSDIADMGGWS